MLLLSGVVSGVVVATRLVSVNMVRGVRGPELPPVELFWKLTTMMGS